MAFAYTQTAIIPMGNKRASVGTYASTEDDTGGNVVTGLRVVEQFFMSSTGSAAAADNPAADETFPLVDTAVTIKTTANDTGHWMAIGV